MRQFEAEWSPEMNEGSPIERAVAHLEDPARKNLFVMGCLSRGITVLSQQRRALAVVQALVERRRYSTLDRVGIVGGGFSGVTAAAAATLEGFEVELFEAKHRLLHMFAGNRTRYVDPHLYDWPSPSWTQSNAGLPILDWHGDIAGKVADQVLEKFHAIARAYPLRVHLGTQVTGIEQDRLALVGADGRPFDAVLLALGFGLEQGLDHRKHVSYWDDDNLGAEVRDPKTQSVVLVSGCGDAGLVDYLRLRISGYDQRNVLDEIFVRDDPAVMALEAELQQIEAELTGHDDAWLRARCRALNTEAIDIRIKQRLRRDTTVYLNGKASSPLSGRTFPLNRFLAWRVLSIDESDGRRRFHGGTLAQARAETGAQRTVVRHGPVRGQTLEPFSGLLERMRTQAPAELAADVGIDAREASLQSELVVGIARCADGTVLSLAGCIQHFCRGHQRDFCEALPALDGICSAIEVQAADFFDLLGDEWLSASDIQRLVGLVRSHFGEPGSAFAAAAGLAGALEATAQHLTRDAFFGGLSTVRERHLEPGEPFVPSNRSGFLAELEPGTWDSVAGVRIAPHRAALQDHPVRLRWVGRSFPRIDGAWQVGASAFDEVTDLSTLVEHIERARGAGIRALALPEFALRAEDIEPLRAYFQALEDPILVTCGLQSGPAVTFIGGHIHRQGKLHPCAAGHDRGVEVHRKAPLLMTVSRSGSAMTIVCRDLLRVDGLITDLSPDLVLVPSCTSAQPHVKNRVAGLSDAADAHTALATSGEGEPGRVAACVRPPHADRGAELRHPLAGPVVVRGPRDDDVQATPRRHGALLDD